jgi:hypothetical protein
VSEKRKFRISRFGAIAAALTIADIALSSYILSGYVVSSRIVIPDRRVTTLARAYDANMKPSPQVLWAPVHKQAMAAIPVIDANSVANRVTNLDTSAENIPDATPVYRAISAPDAVPQSEPSTSLSRATKRSNTT